MVPSQQHYHELTLQVSGRRIIPLTHHTLARRSGKRRRIQACADRPSPTSSKNIGDGRRRRCNACPERKTTRSCHTCGVSVCKQHSTVVMTCLECAEGAVDRLKRRSHMTIGARLDASPFATVISETFWSMVICQTHAKFTQKQAPGMWLA